jgi:HK97 family phage major capsid protein
LQNDGLFQGLERNLKFFGGARKCAKVIRAERGENFSWSYSDDTGNVGYRVGQNGTPTQTGVTYQKKTLGVYEYLTTVYPVSLQLLQDAQIDVSADVGEVLGQRLGRVTNTDFTNGSGASMPTGFMTDASAGATAAGAAIAYDDLVNLKFSFDPVYMEDPEFTYTMHSLTLSKLWQVVDGNSRPLFWNQMNSLADGNPLQILNSPIVMNNDMPQVASGKKPIAGIIPRKFIIRDVKEAQILVMKERYLDQLAIGFIGYLRTDCKLLNANCCKVLTMP